MPRADAVINAAAYTAVDRAESDEELATASTPMRPAPWRGLRRARYSVRAYLDRLRVCGQGDAPWQPDDPTAPQRLWPHQAGGRGGGARSGRAHAILRTSWVFSAHGSNFVKTMLRLAPTRER